MKNKDFVILCLRLLSIYLGIIGLSSLPQIVAIFSKSFDMSPVEIALTPLIFIVCSLVLYFNAPKISHFIVEFGNDEEGNMRRNFLIMTENRILINYNPSPVNCCDSQ